MRMCCCMVRNSVIRVCLRLALSAIEVLISYKSDNVFKRHSPARQIQSSFAPDIAILLHRRTWERLSPFLRESVLSQALQGLSGQSIPGPLFHGNCAWLAIELNRRLVPIEHF